MEAMRDRTETLHSKANEKLIAMFDGIEEERKVSITNAGTMKITYR